MRKAFNWYDILALSVSGGKDSQVMTDLVIRQALAAGFPKDAIVLIHADLGRVEWKDALECCEAWAEHYGVRLMVMVREQGDLLEHVRKHGKWPGMKTTQYCTSDHKRGQIWRAYTILANEWRETSDRKQCRILECVGIAGHESPARDKMPTWKVVEKPTSGKKLIEQWLPIHALPEAEIWATMEALPTKTHGCYALGMPRASCMFCIYACRNALLIAAEANTDLLREYAEVEAEIGHQFRGDPNKPRKGDISLVELLQAFEDGERGDVSKITGAGPTN